MAVLAGATAIAAPARGDDERVARHLERLRTLEAMTEFVGRKADSCFWASAGTELCSWILSKKDKPAWRKLAHILHSGIDIGLICEFEVEGPGADNWCFARPRQTDRRRWEASSKSQIEAIAPLARSTIENAETLPAVSQVMGIGPDECKPTSERSASICVWRADRRVYGHAVVAASIGAYTRKKVRLECTFPDDGSKRAPGSCTASIGY